MRYVAILLMTILLPGCASLFNAGYSSFEASPFTNEKTGETVCCVVKIKSGKEYSTLTAHVSKAPDGSIVVDIAETGTKAFDGQKIAADAGISNAGTAAKGAAALLVPQSTLVGGAAALFKGESK